MCRCRRSRTFLSGNPVAGLLLTAPGRHLFRPTFSNWRKNTVFPPILDLRYLNVNRSICQGCRVWSYPFMELPGDTFWLHFTCRPSSADSLIGSGQGAIALFQIDPFQQLGQKGYRLPDTLAAATSSTLWPLVSTSCSVLVSRYSDADIDVLTWITPLFPVYDGVGLAIPSLVLIFIILFSSRLYRVQYLHWTIFSTAGFLVVITV